MTEIKETNFLCMVNFFLEWDSGCFALVSYDSISMVHYDSVIFFFFGKFPRLKHQVLLHGNQKYSFMLVDH